MIDGFQVVSTVEVTQNVSFTHGEDWHISFYTRAPMLHLHRVM